MIEQKDVVEHRGGTLKPKTLKSIVNLSLRTSVFLLAPMAFAAGPCPKNFQQFKVNSPAFADSVLRFAQTPHGPALFGLSLSTPKYKGKTTDGILFHPKQHEWCFFSVDSKPQLNCEALNGDNVGNFGSGQMVFIAGPEAGKPKAVVMHASRRELIVYAIDPEKPVSPSVAHRSFDRSQPQLHIKPSVEDMADGQTRNSLEVNTFNIKEAMTTGMAKFELIGSLSDKGELLPGRLNLSADAAPAVDLVGQSFIEPNDCKPREIKKFSGIQSGAPAVGDPKQPGK